MPISSLFSRKGSRKNNQPNDKSTVASKQNGISECTKKETRTGENCKAEISHALPESIEELKLQKQTGEVLLNTEASLQQSAHIEDNREKKLPCDNPSEIREDIRSDDVRLKEADCTTKAEEKIPETPGPENLIHEKVLQQTGESVDANRSGLNDQEQQDTTLTQDTTAVISGKDYISGDMPSKHISGTGEEFDAVLEKYDTSDESQVPKDTENVANHASTAGEISTDLPKEELLHHSQENSGVCDEKLEDLKVTEEEIETDLNNSSQFPAPTSASVVQSFNDSAFVETNVPKEPQTSESEMKILSSGETGTDLSSALLDMRGPEDELGETYNSGCTNSVSSAAKGQLDEVATDGSINEIEEDSFSEDSHPQQELHSEDMASVTNELATNDCESISDKKQSDSGEIEETGDECDLMADTSTERVTEETDKDVILGKIHPVPESVNQDVCGDTHLQAQTEPTMNETPKESNEISSCENAEQSDGELTDNGTNLLTSLSSTSTSMKPAVGSVEEKTEIHREMEEITENQGNSSDREEIEFEQVTAEETVSRTETLKSNSGLSGDNFSSPLDSSEVLDVQSRTSLEDSLDSFPSGCEDFLGGQRTLMAASQYAPPSWKVGYLQVKLPTKSRGRGKLKVWKQRWVVIQMDEFVKDAKDPSLMINIYSSECSNARRHSALFWCTVSASKTVLYRSQSRTHKYAFSISVDNDVILHLAADSETASEEWMAAIRNLLWPPSPVLQLEKVLHGNDFEVSVIDNEFTFHAGLLGTYGNMKVTSNKLIFSHPQTDHVIQEWYLNTLDKFQLLPQTKEDDAFKIVVMHTGKDSSTGSGQIILFCPDAVAMLQSIASTIHKLLQYRTSAGKVHNQQELADLAEWLSPALSGPPVGEAPEDYYKVPRRQIRSLLDIPNFSFEKPLSSGSHSQSQEAVTTKPSSLMTSPTSGSAFSFDSGISMTTQPDEFLNCSVTSFTIGGHPVRSHTSSESSDSYSPPCSPEMERKNPETT